MTSNDASMVHPSTTPGSRPPDFTAWVEHFRANPRAQSAMEQDVDWDARCTLDPVARAAFVRSFRRFELGEDGDGARLLAKARRAGDPVYLEALQLLVAEEQRHSALFRRGLEHLEAPTLDAHWSDAAFTRLRRLLGLRTELALFLVAESVAMGYFTALASRAPDEVLRGIGRRIASDEVHHLRFQVDRLRQGFLRTPRPVRAVVGAVWGVVAVGAATVLVGDHARAFRATGLRPARAWLDAVRTFRANAHLVLDDPSAGMLGPAPAALVARATGAARTAGPAEA
ncbi:ferritin-like domain-containing protein [Cellulosimicrobium sp. NPDC057127]|uniref:ferritin-like domain-containing protein n=1 Tax=Cellulosimicrobium sp. NPDC057127 TaxID=3346026 RepID=UPI0036384B7E